MLGFLQSGTVGARWQPLRNGLIPRGLEKKWLIDSVVGGRRCGERNTTVGVERTLCPLARTKKQVPPSWLQALVDTGGPPQRTECPPHTRQVTSPTRTTQLDAASMPCLFLQPFSPRRSHRHRLGSEDGAGRCQH